MISIVAPWRPYVATPNLRDSLEVEEDMKQVSIE